MDKATCFRIALAASGCLLKEWVERHGFSSRSVYGVLEGTVTSARISGLIDDFSAEQIARLGPLVEAANAYLAAREAVPA